MAKVRSPNYPAISLREAIEKANVLHAKNGRHPMMREAVAKNLGYGGLSGASMPIISALTKYALLEPAGDGLRLSDLALTVIAEQPGSAERVDALRRAATSPSLFAELSKSYPGETVPSAATIESYLLQRGFTRKAAAGAIRAYRETRELVSSESSAYDNSQMIDEVVAEANRRETDSGKEQRGHNKSSAPVGEKERLRFTLSGDRGVRIIFSGPDPTQAEIDELMDYLKISRRTFPAAERERRPGPHLAQEERPDE